MVYQERTTEIYLPKHFSVIDGRYTLTISNGVFSQTLFTDMQDISGNNNFYFFDLENELVIPVGEYTYILKQIDGDLNIECGIMVYGEYKKEDVKTINKDKTINIQFNGKRS